MAKYRTPEQRESIIWLVAVKDKLEEYADEWPAKGRNLITSEIIPKLEEWAVQLMDGISPKEGEAIINLSKRTNPVLIASDFSSTDDKITVDSDDYYTLAEHSLEYCKFAAMNREIQRMTNAKDIKAYLKQNYNCKECDDPGTCQLRQVLLTFLVPPLSLDGKCQYLRGEDEA